MIVNMFSKKRFMDGFLCRLRAPDKCDPARERRPVSRAQFLS
jgi:hypothetical protein